MSGRKSKLLRLNVQLDVLTKAPGTFTHAAIANGHISPPTRRELRRAMRLALKESTRAQAQET